MKKAAIFFVVGIFFFLAGYYFVSIGSPFEVSKIQEIAEENDISPGEWDKLDALVKEISQSVDLFEYLSRDFYIAAVLFSIGVLFSFSSIHMFVDKIFFKEFYRQPSAYDAFRRAALLILALLTVFIMRVYKLEIYYLVLVPIALVLVEILYFEFFKKDILRKISELNEKIKKSEVSSST